MGQTTILGLPVRLKMGIKGDMEGLCKIPLDGVENRDLAFRIDDPSYPNMAFFCRALRGNAARGAANKM